MGRLEGKVALITGGTSGMGEATAHYLVNEGAQVVVTGRSKERGVEIAAELGERGFYLETDVSKPAEVEHMIGWTHDKFGRIDCLFNNAGAGENIMSIEEVTADGIRREFDLLVTAVLLGMKHVVPIMRAQGGGSIVNNASIAGMFTGPGMLVYSAAKAAVINATQWVAMELASARIRVNAISPGSVYTPIFVKIFDPDSTDAAKSESKIREAFANIVPVGRAGEGREVGALVAYLASDDSAYVTGQNIPIDGGITTGWSRQYQLGVFDTMARVIHG